MKAIGTSWMMGRLELDVQIEVDEVGFIGDFLSRLWTILGEPEICQEGFIYTIYDKEKDIVFTAGFSSFGPGYGGFSKDFEKLKLTLKDFEVLLKTVKLADCEIEFNTDFGLFSAGAKDGIAFDMLLNG